MVSQRLGIRIDPERRRKLQQMAADEDESVSELIRTLIDEGYEARRRARRMAAVERLVNARVGEPIEPDELKRLINEAASPGDLY